MTTTTSKRPRARLALVATTVVMGVISAACSGGEAGAEGEPQATREEGERIELSFWAWVPGVDAAVDLWNSENPDVQVVLENIPAGSSGGYAQIYAALEAGNGPDLAQIEYQELPGLLLQGGAVNLSDYGADELEDDFVDWQWQQTTFSGSSYAIPQASGPMAFYYRADRFAELGITPPATWEDFEQAARAIREADPNAYISTFPPGNSAWFTSLAQQAGAQWFDVDGEDWSVNMTDPETLKVAEYWDRLVSEDLVQSQPDFANGWYADLQDGDVLGWVSASWGDAILTGNAPDTAGSWSVAQMPQWEEGASVSANWGGSSTAVLEGSEYVEDALAFATWLNTDPASIDLLIAGGYGWPAASGAFEGSALDFEDPFFGGQNYNEVFAEADQNIDRNWTWIPTTNSTFNSLNDGFQEAVAGNGTFVEAVETAEATTVAEMEQRGLTVVDAP